MKERIEPKLVAGFVFLGMFLVLISLSLFAGAVQPHEPEAQKIVDWDKIKQAYINFLACPMDENSARAFLESMPEDKRIREQGNKEEFIRFMFGQEKIFEGNSYKAGGTYILLSNEIWAGNKPAIEAAFRLLNLVDDKNTEDIKVSLSHLIRLKPELFLETGLKYLDSSYMREDGYPVNYFMEAYLAMPRAQVYEMEKRIEALENIREEEYKEAKKVCISKLKEEISKIKSDVQMKEMSANKISEIVKAGEKAGVKDIKIFDHFISFIQYPSVQNARELCEAIPEKYEDVGVLTIRQFTGFMVVDNYDYYSMLLYEAYAGNKWAATSLFRLLNYSDGAGCEELLGSLGNLIRVDPEGFLLMYKKERALLKEFIRDDPIVYPAFEYWEGLPELPFPGYQERIEKCLIKDRIKKLELIENPELMDIREYCLTKLRNELKNLHE